MFEPEHTSIFEEEDDFGVQEYREDADVLFKLNSIKVKLIKPSKGNKENLQGDFLGTKTKRAADEISIIQINLATSAPKAEKMKEDGYHSRGSVTINAFCKYDVAIDDSCMIEFIKSKPVGIVKGDKFRVEITDTGDYKGQYTFQNFNLIQVN